MFHEVSIFLDWDACVNLCICVLSDVACGSGCGNDVVASDVVCCGGWNARRW